MAHWSDCAVHNAPALPVGLCDCGNDAPRSAVAVPDTMELGDAMIAALKQALEDVVRDINDYERGNNLAPKNRGPSPGRTECWDSVARAKALLASMAINDRFNSNQPGFDALKQSGKP